MSGAESVDTTMGARYIAKYVTKSTEATGRLFSRFTTETINLYADPDGSHTERLIEACWILGRHWRRLRRGAPMFGFAGHPFTRSHRHPVSFQPLRTKHHRHSRTT